jgi:hypothetical protein
MAKKGQGWLRKKPYAAGLTWLFCFQVKKQPGATPVENTKPVGLVADLPDEKAAWMEVGRLGLTRYLDNPIQRQPKFNALAQHWRAHELRKHGQIGRKAGETADRDEHNLNAFILPRWGTRRGLGLPRQMLGSRSKYSSSSFFPPSPAPNRFSDWMNSIRSIHLTIL